MCWCILCHKIHQIYEQFTKNFNKRTLYYSYEILCIKKNIYFMYENEHIFYSYETFFKKRTFYYSLISLKFHKFDFIHFYKLNQGIKGRISKVVFPSQVKGERLKIACITLRGFKSPCYHQFY